MPTIDGHHIDWATVCHWIDENRPDLTPILGPSRSPQRPTNDTDDDAA